MRKYKVTGRVNEGADFGSVELGDSSGDPISKKDQAEQNNSYNPFSNRTVRQPTSFIETIAHLLKASLGTGILAMPFAFKNSGYAVGVMGTVIIGILCTYTIHLLISASHELCVRKKVPSLTYSGTVAAAFEEGPACTRGLGSTVRSMADAFLVLYQMGSSCIYVVFIAVNLQSVCNSYFNTNTDVRWYMIYMLIPMILISLIRSLKLLAPFSSVATFLSGISFLIIFYYIFREPLSVVDRSPVGLANTIPLFFGTVLFAMEAIGVVLPLENEMKEPERFASRFGVLNIALVPITILYLVVGLFGYLKYGENVQGSITLDIPQNELLSCIVKICLSFSIYIGYALSNYVAFEIVWGEFEKRNVDNNAPKIYWEYTIRIGIVFGTFLLAIIIPFLEILISLMGSLCLSAVGIALPAIVNHLTFIENFNKGTWQYYVFSLRNLLIILIAVYALVIGVYQNTMQIIHTVTES